jgi:hypothetical protein
MPTRLCFIYFHQNISLFLLFYLLNYKFIYFILAFNFIEHTILMCLQALLFERHAINVANETLCSSISTLNQELQLKLVLTLKSTTL